MRTSSGMRWRAARPDRGRAHAEVAVAEHRDGVAALLLQRERGADRNAGAGAEPAAAVLAEIRHAVLQRPDVERPAAAERAEGDVLRIVELVAQRRGDVLHGERRRRCRCLGLRRHLRLPRLLAAAVERAVELGDDDVAGRCHQHVDGRQRLVFHVGAGVQVLVERAGDDLGADLAGASAPGAARRRGRSSRARG